MEALHGATQSEANAWTITKYKKPTIRGVTQQCILTRTLIKDIFLNKTVNFARQL